MDARLFELIKIRTIKKKKTLIFGVFLGVHDFQHLKSLVQLNQSKMVC